MKRKTHIMVGLAITYPLIASQAVGPIGILGLYGSVAPDLDIKLNIRHRTITHSLLILFASTSALYVINKSLAISWFYNYFFHMFIDCFTVKGVPFLYPFIKKNYGFKIFQSNGIGDILTLLLSASYFLSNFVHH